MKVQVYITEADYPRVNTPPPFDHPQQPDLSVTLEVDVIGLDVPSVPSHASHVMPDTGELQRLLEGPVAAAVRAALA